MHASHWTVKNANADKDYAALVYGISLQQPRTLDILHINATNSTNATHHTKVL